MANNSNNWGFARLSQLPSTLQATNLTPQTLLDDLRDRQAIYDRMQAQMLGLFCERVTVAQERYAIPGSGTLQPLDEQGVPLPVRPSGYLTNGYPLYMAGTAAGRTRITKVVETIEDIFRDTEDAEARDMVWLRTQVIAALLTPTARTFVDDEAGSITVRPLAITSDSVTYLRNSGSMSTAQHYLAQTAAIADATNPYTTIYTTLAAYPSNMGRRIVAFIPTDLVATTEALTTFIAVADPDIRLGSTSDVLLSQGADLLSMGDRVLGKVGHVWVVEWSALPANNILAMVEGRPPLAMRERPEPELQGFFPEVVPTHSGGVERRRIRIAGFGVRNRISALAYQVNNGDTTFDAVTSYTAPVAN